MQLTPPKCVRGVAFLRQGRGYLTGQVLTIPQPWHTSAKAADYYGRPPPQAPPPVEDSPGGSGSYIEGFDGFPKPLGTRQSVSDQSSPRTNWQIPGLQSVRSGDEIASKTHQGNEPQFVAFFHSKLASINGKSDCTFPTSGP